MCVTNDFFITELDDYTEFRFNRPASLNSLTFDMYEEIETMCRHVDPQKTKALIITAEGEKAFASGTDISNFKSFQSSQDAIDYEIMIDRVISAVERCFVPVIVSLHGVVAGGGAALAAAADIRLATTDTRLGMPIARTLGNCLSIANLERLVNTLGESRVRYMLLTAEFLALAPLVESGFVSEVLDNANSCDERSRQLAKNIAQLAPRTVQATREGLARLKQAPLPDDSDLIEFCYMSEDFEEAVSAFFEKRKAKWRTSS